MATKQEILKQIDDTLKLWAMHREKSKYEDLSDLHISGLYTEISTILGATLDRLAPLNSQYRKAITEIMPNKVGALRALRRDYEADYLIGVENLIRADVFADFIEMAEHLLEQGYKDPSAVVVGSVLEEHLRTLCNSRSLPTQVSGKPKKADSMNADLATATAYNKLDQKNVTAWLDLRNKAAHGRYSEYTADQVANMLAGVREFMARINA